jgi:hypothetical protein
MRRTQEQEGLSLEECGRTSSFLVRSPRMRRDPERDLERDLGLDQAQQVATEATEEEEGVGIEAIVVTVVEEVLKDQETVSAAQIEKNKTRSISLKTKLQLLFYINLSSSPFLSSQFCLGLLPSYFQCWLHFCIVALSLAFLEFHLYKLNSLL